ncbi:MAG: 2'-5' RNA ligase family protein [Synechococcales bacterium]|nr:2'-5' RNA ligase family protein [Synechococcales bacterium]
MPHDPAKPRFFVALTLPADAHDYANRVIRELGDRYQTRTAKAPPHITLQPPFLWEMGAIADLEKVIDAVAQSHSPIPISLSGFSAFKPRVLYINVGKTEGLLTLQTNLRLELERQLDILDPKAKSRAFSPHVTVASRNMTPQIFKRVWAELEPRQVSFEFVSDRLTLLIHDGHQWQVRSQFTFANIPA